jgi:hypothetical protein
VSPLVAIALALAAATLVPSPAAQTFVVSAAGGPGVAFTDIPPAVAAVPDGATLLVRPGNYSSFTIDAKGLTLLMDAGATVHWPAGAQVTVRNLAASQHVVLHGLELESAVPPAVLRCENCAGTVVLQRCRTVPAPGWAGGRLVVLGCREVRLADCVISPVGSFSAAALFDSNVYFARSRLAAGGWYAAGIIATAGSACELVDCEVRTAAITLSGAPLTVDAGAVARVLGATVLDATPLASSANPAIGGGGAVLLDPGVVLLANVPPIAPTVLSAMLAMPAVTAPSSALGGAASATMTLPPAAFGGLLVGPPAPAFLAPPFPTPLGLDPLQAVPIAAGVASPLVVGYTVPALAALRGVRFVFQGWSHDPAAGFQASNAVTVVPW